MWHNDCAIVNQTGISASLSGRIWRVAGLAALAPAFTRRSWLRARLRADLMLPRRDLANETRACSFSALISHLSALPYPFVFSFLFSLFPYSLLRRHRAGEETSTLDTTQPALHHHPATRSLPCLVPTLHHLPAIEATSTLFVICSQRHSFTFIFTFLREREREKRDWRVGRRDHSTIDTLKRQHIPVQHRFTRTYVKCLLISGQGKLGGLFSFIWVRTARV